MSNDKSITEALIVVDMQDYFLGNMVHDGGGQERLNGFIENVCREVKLARSKRIPIIMLEYGGLDYDGDGYYATITNDDILCELKGYSRKYFAEKMDDCGSEEVLSVLYGDADNVVLRRGSSPVRKWGKWGEPMSVRVVGCNLDACLMETVRGLSRVPRMNVKVVADAAMNVYDTRSCDADWKEEHFGNSKKVILV